MFWKVAVAMARCTKFVRNTTRNDSGKGDMVPVNNFRKNQVLSNTTRISKPNLLHFIRTSSVKEY